MSDGPEVDLGLSREGFGALRLRRGVPVVPMAGVQDVHSGAYAVTGGLGGLGLRAARLLVEKSVAALVLSSRSGRVSYEGQGLGEQLAALLSSVTCLLSVVPCNVEDADEARSLLSSNQLSGLLHTASGFGADLIADMSPSQLGHLFCAKGVGGRNLHTASMTSSLDTCLFYSSLSTLAIAFTTRGAAHYAAANTYLEAVSLGRRGGGVRGSALHMSLVCEQGSAARMSEQRQRLTGFAKKLLGLNGQAGRANGKEK